MSAESFLLFGDDDSKQIAVGDLVDFTLASGKVVSATVLDGFMLMERDGAKPFSPMRLGLLKAVRNRTRGWEHKW